MLVNEAMVRWLNGLVIKVPFLPHHFQQGYCSTKDCAHPSVHQTAEARRYFYVQSKRRVTPGAPSKALHWISPALTDFASRE